MGLRRVDESAYPLLGRGREADSVSLAIDDAVAGVPVFVLVEGEAGIGKSRLLGVAVDAANDAGAVVMAASGEPLRSAIPLGLVATAVATRGRRPETVEDAIASISEVAATAPVILVLDDLQWADQLSLACVGELVDRHESVSASVIAAARTGPRPPGVDALADRIGAAGVHLTVGPLENECAAELAALVAGAEPDGLDLTKASGNPLLIIEMTRQAQTRAPSAATALLDRLVGFSSDTRQVVNIASILGESFSLTRLARLLDTPVPVLAGHVTDLLDAGVFIDRDEVLSFRHDLIREAVYDAIPPSVRKGLHAHVARVLASELRSSTSVAAHFMRGAEAGDVEAVSVLMAAARTAADADPEQAAQFVATALELLPAHGYDESTLRAVLARLFVWAGDELAAEREARLAVATATSQDARADALGALANVLHHRGLGLEAIDIASQVLEIDGLNDATRLAAKAARANFSYFQQRLDEADREATEVFDAAHHADITAVASFAANTRCLVAFAEGRLPDALQYGQLSITTGLAAGNTEVWSSGWSRTSTPVAGVAYLQYALSLFDADRADEARRAVEARAEQLSRHRNLYAEPLTHYIAGLLAFHELLPDDCLTEVEVGRAAARRARNSFRATFGAILELLVAVDHGDERRAQIARVAVDHAFTAGRVSSVEHWLGPYARAEQAAWQGDIETQRLELESAWDALVRVGAVGHARSFAASLTRLRLASTDAAGAREVLPVIRTAAERAGAVPSAWALVQQIEGLIHDDIDALLAAVDGFRASPRVRDFAACCEDAAAALARCGDARAADLMQEAIDVYDQRGAIRRADRARATLRSFGQHSVRGGTRPRSRVGWEALSPTEARVVDLVVEGLTSREIGARLYISPRTVDTHIAHIFDKVGVRSRRQLTAYVQNVREVPGQQRMTAVAPPTLSGP